MPDGIAARSDLAAARPGAQKAMRQSIDGVGYG